MKDMFFTFAMLLCSLFVVQAQDNAPKTLFGSGSGETEIGFYVAPGYQLTQAAGQTVHSFQGSAGVIFNKRFALGAAFYSTLNEFTPEMEIDDRLYLDLRYGGVRAEYILNPDNLVHFSFPLTIGGGEASMDYKGDLSSVGDPFGEDHFFFVEPGVQAEVNLIKNARLFVGASYRFVSGLDYDYNSTVSELVNIQSSDINGLALNLGIRFGLF
jgi:hypothetical protein